MFKQLLTTVIAGTAVVAIVGLVDASSSSASDRIAATCSAAQLHPFFGGSQGAAGTLQETWRVRNVGAHNCRLDGYAGIVNYRADGRPLPTSVSHFGTPHPFVLTPGQHASFDLRYPNPGIVGCTAENPAHMLILTPGSARPVIANGGLASCHGHASESPLRHGN